MTKKNYISVALFLFLFISVFIYLDKVFISSHSYINTNEDFNDLSKKTNIDVLFFGSSHSYTAYNPLIINHHCKTISYNLGSDSQILSLTDLSFIESLKYTKPKLVILEVYPGVANIKMTELAKSYQLRLLDAIPNYSILKYKKINHIFSKKELFSVYLPLIRNHSKWNNISFLQLSRKIKNNTNNYFFSQGYLGAYRKIEKNREKYIDFQKLKVIKIKKKNTLNKKAKVAIQNFINIAKDHNIEVLVVSSPDIKSRLGNYYFFDELFDLCKSQNVNFINLNNFYNEIGLGLDDFRDTGHLNLFGGNKTSFFLANYINKNYSLPNKVDDSIWKSLDIRYKYFTQKNKNEVCETILNKKLNDEIIVNKIKIQRIYNNYKVKLVFNKNKKLQELLEKYFVGFYLYPIKKERSLLSKKSKKADIIFDIHNFYNTSLQKSKYSIEKIFKTNIKNIKKIEIFLFNKNKYTGVIGDKITIDTLKFY